MHHSLIAFATLLLVSSTGAAQTGTAKWQYLEGLDELTQKTSCQAFVRQATPLGNLELRFSFVKDRTEVPSFFVRHWNQGPQLPERQFVLLSDKIKHPLFLHQLAASTQEPNVYWYVPVAFPSLLDKAIGDQNLKIQDKAGKLIFQATLSGSADAFSKVSTCLKGGEYLPVAFLKSFTAKLTQLPQISTGTTQMMIENLQRAFQASLVAAKKNQELSKLMNELKSLISQEDKAQKEYTSAFSKWDTENSKLIGLRKKVDDLTAAIAQAKADIPKWESELPLAQKTLSEAQAEYDRVRAQVLPLETEVKTISTELNSIKQSILAKQNLIQANEKKIPELQAERSRTISKIKSLESDLESAEYDLQRAEREFYEFRPEEEYREQLRRDPWYDSNVRERESKRSEVYGKRYQLSLAQSEENRAEADFNQCRRQTPPPDCSSEQSNWDAKKRAVRVAERELQSLEWDIDRLNDRIQSSEQTARRETDRKYEELQSKRDRARSEVNSINDEIATAHRRVRKIDTDIPRMRTEIADAKNALPGLHENQKNTEASLAQAQSRLDQLKQSINFGAIEAQYNSAKTRVSQLQSSIKSSKEMIPKAEAEIKKHNSSIKALEPTVAKLLAAKDKSASTLKGIQDKLAPGRENESVLKAEIELASRQFAEAREIFQGIYEAIK